MNIQKHHKIGQSPLEASDILEGWDTVFAIRYSDVNATIASSGASPDTFFHQVTEDTDVSSIQGTFEDWSLTVGGAGHLVMMALPVPVVTLKRTGHPDAQRTQVTYTIKVELTAIPQGPGDEGGTLHALVIKAPVHGANAVVTVEDVDYAGADTDHTVRFYLQGLMQEWLNENIQEFKHVFATVNLNAKAAKEQFQWLRPTHTSYAVYDDHTTLASGIFAVLCMTENRDPSPDQIIASDVIPAGKRSAFLISKERFLSKMMKPGMGQMFTGPVKADPKRKWPEDYFHLEDKDTMLTNTHDIYIEDMVLEAGEDPVRCEVPARMLQLKLQETYLEYSLKNFWHPYKKWLGNYLVTIHHDIYTRNIARLEPGQVFALFPGVNTDDPEKKIASHIATVKKTEFAKALDIALLVLNILSLVLPASKWVWGKCVTSAAEVVDDTAIATTEMVQTAAATAPEVAEAGATGAQAIIAVERGEASFGSWLMGEITAKRAAALFAMSTLGLSYDLIVGILAEKDAESELPNYADFAAELMAPVQWPMSSGYVIEEVAFNGCLQSVGTPNFTF
jgi:hypothetical protein